MSKYEKAYEILKGTLIVNNNGKWPYCFWKRESCHLKLLLMVFKFFKPYLEKCFDSDKYQEPNYYPPKFQL